MDPPPPDPPPGHIPTETPDPARPLALPGEIRVTWIGHATFLIQLGRLNLLTDPVFSDRVSPVSWAGPRRLVPPALSVDELPSIHAVLLSHSHYDHLDRPSVIRLHRRFGDELEWITPLGYQDWFRELGVEAVRELDWWERGELDGTGGPAGITACPAQHWCRRGFRTNQRLWAAYGVEGPAGQRVFFGGDSGYFPGYREIGERMGPFDLLLLPIGAYEPRWFMKTSHMNPEDAVQAYRDLGGRGVFVGTHWGTFRLTDEHPLEPPRRTRRAWRSAGLPPGDLRLPGIGGTVAVGR
jgi:N-acyl-phosphatidylethanolamine-hydrolysing phospholipase D